MIRFTALILTLCCFLAQSDRVQPKRANTPPVIEKIEATPSALTFCPKAAGELICHKANRTTVTLSVVASASDGGSLKYSYSPSVGEILGSGSLVTWKLAGQTFGTHETKVTVTDSNGSDVSGTIKVQIGACSSCMIPSPPCPNIAVRLWSKEAHRAEKVLFYVDVQTVAYFRSRPDYLWTVNGGKILKGEHTPQIEVEVTGEISTDVTATVDVKGIASECNGGASESIRITP